MSHARYIVGDVFDVLATMPDDSVDLVLTSPPFLAQRNYLLDDHPLKAKELGAESTPGEYIDNLLDVVEALDRVLAPHGSICVELGDTYSGSGGGGGDYLPGGMREGQPGWGGSAARAREGNAAHARMKNRRRSSWPGAKSLTMIPELFRISLAYGQNPLTGRLTPSWLARNTVRWHRPNPPVGELGDKFRPATTDMVVITKNKKRYFDLDAVRTPLTEPNHDQRIKKGSGNPNGMGRPTDHVFQNPAGAPPLDTWILPTAAYSGAHYATWPPDLCRIPIQSMCPIRVCTQCGEPSKRITEVTHEAQRDVERQHAEPKGTRMRGEIPIAHAQHMEHGRANKIVTTTGWTDCGHDAWRNGLVLDPFAGTGVTLRVATGHGRDAVGIDIDSRNADLARERIGELFLTIEEMP